MTTATKPPPKNIDKNKLIPLRKWIEGEASAQLVAGFGEKERQNVLILRKTTIAYGITELLRHDRSHPSVLSPISIQDQCSIDNFIVRISGDKEAMASNPYAWNDIVGESKRRSSLQFVIVYCLYMFIHSFLIRTNILFAVKCCRIIIPL